MGALQDTVGSSGATLSLGENLMPKMKTNRAAAKRFKVTGSGRIRRPKTGGQHSFRGKSRTRKRRLRDNDMVHPTMEKRIKTLLPYAG